MLLGVICSTLLLTQASQSSIGGVVRDAEGGAPIAEAVVALPDIDRVVLTDSLGRYRFPDLPPGPQHLTVRRIGYAPRTLHAFAPDQGLLQIDISLHPVPVRLAPLVVRNAPVLRGLDPGDSTSYPDRSASIGAIHNDPFLPEPDGFLALQGGEITSTPESPSGIHVRGAPSDQTGYVLDGVLVLSPYHTAGIFSAWNPDVMDRIEVSSASPSPAYPAVLSGTVSAVTRSPGSTLTTQGTMSTTQTRLALDGPLGNKGAGFLASLRTGYPGWIAPRNDPSYLKGGTQDALARLEAPLARGKLRLLFYEMGNSIAGGAGALAGPFRNSFEWSSRSLGAEWVRHSSSETVRLLVWDASSEAEATWLGDTTLGLASTREDQGLLGTVARGDSRVSTTIGARLERSRTDYQSRSLDSLGPDLQLAGERLLPSAFLSHDRELNSRVSAGGAVSAIAGSGGPYWNLQGQLRLRVSPALSMSLSYVRAHQFSQSLRNSESVVGNIFPAELYLNAGLGGAPVARNDREILAADYRPTSNLRLGAQAYLSRSRGLILVAPNTGEPFAVAGFTTGSGTAPGLSLEANLRGSHYGLLANYSWERVRLYYAGSAYNPSYGDSHGFQLGGIVFPSATSSVRLALTGAAGRNATAVTGDFEWEACNLLDQGCEFGGSPRASAGLGATRLPSYLRLDLGLRQHWHLRLGGRDVMVAVYGTFTNLLGRTNVLTVAVDPTTGRRSSIEMRPRAPLVLGLDWGF